MLVERIAVVGGGGGRGYSNNFFFCFDFFLF